MTIERYECPVCGGYIITDSAKEKIVEIDKHQNHYRWASIAAEKNLQNCKFLLDVDENCEHWIKHKFVNNYIPIGLKDFIKNYPSSVVQLLDRAILNLGRMTSKHGEIGKDILFNAVGSNDYYSLFAKSYKEALGILSLLYEQGLVRYSEENGIMSNASVSAKGWQKIAELEKRWEQSNRAFLAMWFDKSTDKLRNAVKEAVKAAGYDPTEIAVDESPHNDFIMNKVINMITDAKFVIADFTCSPERKVTDGKVPGGVRGGVYFEAGLARGQGKEVIHICKDTPANIARLHFDVNQINTIFWNEENGADGKVVLKSKGANFIDILKHWIIVTTGKGKHYVEVN